MQEFQLPEGMLPEGVTVTAQHRVEDNGIDVKARLVYVCYGVVRVTEQELAESTNATMADKMVQAARQAARIAVEYARDHVGELTQK